MTFLCVALLLRTNKTQQTNRLQFTHFKKAPITLPRWVYYITLSCVHLCFLLSLLCPFHARGGWCEEPGSGQDCLLGLFYGGSSSSTWSQMISQGMVTVVRLPPGHTPSDSPVFHISFWISLALFSLFFVMWRSLSAPGPLWGPPQHLLVSFKNMTIMQLN